MKPHISEVIFFVKKLLSIESYRSEHRFFGLFEHFRLFLANTDFFFFFDFLGIFFSPNTFFSDFCKMTPLFDQKMASFCQNTKNTSWGRKKWSKNQKKKKKSGLARNTLTFSKNAKNQCVDIITRFTGIFRPKNNNPKKCKLTWKMMSFCKNPKKTYLGRKNLPKNQKKKKN